MPTKLWLSVGADICPSPPFARTEATTSASEAEVVEALRSGAHADAFAACVARTTELAAGLEEAVAQKAIARGFGWGRRSQAFWRGEKVGAECIAAGPVVAYAAAMARSCRLRLLR